MDMTKYGKANYLSVEDVKAADTPLITILSKGEEVKGNYGMQVEFEVQLIGSEDTVKYSPFSPSIKKMIPYFKMVQEAERPLLIRGSFKPEDISLLMQSLEPRGLFLYILVKNLKEVKAIKTVLGMD